MRSACLHFLFSAIARFALVESNLLFLIFFLDAAQVFEAAFIN